MIPHKQKTLLCISALAATLCTVSCGLNPSQKAGNPFTPAARQQASDALSDPATRDPKATFKGCWYKTGGKEYQAVKISVKNPGTYHFYANLYYGSTCSKWADDFGNGQLIQFGGFGYTFWFDAFPNQKNMSALWQVGPDKSACIAYETAPAC
jgi:hypothetical protein